LEESEIKKIIFFIIATPVLFIQLTILGAIETLLNFWKGKRFPFDLDEVM